MTVYYVGPGGSDAAAGTSWALRKLTLNGAEDIPVAAGDTVYVAPGVYRELLTVDVSGSGGSPITYIGDVTGQNTDGVGGVVRITGSDDDQSATRASCITATTKSYRTFRGFTMDVTTSHIVILQTTVTNWIFEDCVLRDSGNACIYVNSAGQASVTVRRCGFHNILAAGGIVFNHSADVSDAGHAVENCLFIGGVGILVTNIGGIAITNCTFLGFNRGVDLSANPATGQTITVYNCIFAYSSGVALDAPTGGNAFLLENYNTIYGSTTTRTNVDTGANSVTYPPLFASPLLFDGLNLPQPLLGALSQWSQVRRITGSSQSAEDLYGVTRPTTAAKISWGAVQYQEPIRETTTTYSSSTAALKLDDAGEVQFIVPVTATSTTIAVRCYREADYAGTNPTMVIRQPGQADQTTTDAGSASAWNELTDTFTPATSPPYVVVCLQSLNTASSGSYDAFFDALTVT